METSNLFKLQDEFVKHIIQNTIETYSGQWRLVHEAIQNAHDAIQLNEKIDKGLIEIDLHLGTNKVVVKDNGIGISKEKFNHLFLLGGGDKDLFHAEKILKGSQGVGIKATLFTSKTFKVQTTNDGISWDIELKDSYKFIEDGFDGDVPTPKFKKTDYASGTTIEYSLEDYSIEQFLNEIIEENFYEIYADEKEKEEAEQKNLTIGNVQEILEIYFRTKTYIGCLQALLDINPKLKPIEVTLNIHLDAKSIKKHKETSVTKAPLFSEEKNLGKTFASKFDGKYYDLEERHTELKKKKLGVDRWYDNFETIITNKPKEERRAILVQKFDKNQAKRLLYRTKRDKNNNITLEENPTLINRHSNVLNILNGIYLIVSKKKYLTQHFGIAPKQLLSVNGLPTNIVLNPPRGALAYLNNVHILIDVDTKLGYGKRNISGRRMGIINNFFIDVWSMLRKVTPSIVGFQEEKSGADANAWNKEKEYDDFRNKDNIMQRFNYYFKTTPYEEQEVIALFFELLGRKKITGYFPFRVGINSIYDGLFYINENGKESIPASFPHRHLKVVEFKHKLSFLIRNFKEQDKYLEDIDLVVCWENDCGDDETEYNVISLERDNIIPLPSATLRVQKGTKSCQVIVLKDFVENSGN